MMSVTSSKSSPRIFFLCAFLCVLCICGCRQGPRQESLADHKHFFARYRAIVSDFETKLAVSPENESLRREFALFCYEFRDYQKVIELLADSARVEDRALLAKAYACAGAYDFAIALFEQLKDIPAEDSEYFYLYGKVLEAKNLFPKALSVYARVNGQFGDVARARIASITAHTQDQAPEYVNTLKNAAALFAEELGDEGALLLQVDEDIEVTPENTSISTIHVVAQVLRERGKELAEVDIGYDSTYQRVELEFARTITPDGGAVSAGDQHIRDVSRYLNFPLYSNARAFIISMPAVEVGSCIEYKVKIYSSKLAGGDGFSFMYRIREAYPIFKASFALRLPDGRTPGIKLFNESYASGINMQPQVSMDGVRRKLHWDFSRVRPIIPEYGMPESSYVNPAIVISSFTSWQQVYEWWHALYRDKLSVTPEIAQAIERISAGTRGKRDLAKKMYEFVAKNIRYVAIEYGEGGHEPHNASEIFANRYGDCKDQAILLVAMLRASGLPAYPVLLPTRSAYPIDEHFASINFDHAIACVMIDGELVFMDPTSETASFADLPLSDQGRKALVFFDDGYRVIETPSYGHNRLQCTMDISLSPQEDASIARSVESEGFFASAYRGYVKYTHPALIEEDIRKKMVAISSSSRLGQYRIERCDDFDQKPLLSYQFTTEQFLNHAGSLRIVPVLDEGYLDHKLIANATRSYPIDLEGAYAKSAHVRIRLPESLRVSYLPKTQQFENRWCKLSLAYRHEDGIIDFTQEFRVLERFVVPKDYQEFKSALQQALYALKEQVVLEKKR